jgi:L-alanine-DL-glutamate epimerase-like enolase superfamily enzyme
LKIRGCEAFIVALPWRRLHKMAMPGGTLGNYVIVRVFTEEGVEGLGEATVLKEWGGDHGRYFGESPETTVQLITSTLGPALEGADPFAIEAAHQRMDTAVKGYPYAKAALDQALHDIKGKALGVPVYELLGGPTRDRIRVYGQAENPEATRRVMAEGYTSMKTTANDSRGRPARYSENPDFIDGLVEKVAAIREVVGPKFDLAIEMHADSPPQVAMVIIKALEKFQPWFFEEPIQHQNLPLMAEMAKKTHIPFATGERMVTKWQFRDLLNLGAAQFLQPDITHCGGITELKAIATLAEAYYAAMLPHSREGIVGTVPWRRCTCARPSRTSSRTNCRASRPHRTTASRAVISAGATSRSP